ncbi:TPA: nitrogenase iron-molybdenum cofactor biosynthesis protein NifN [Klebsiella quasipneumoniae]|uniref:nitrogenase iron-molybdenum cofactor biosynthesis protein NifN n=1 Tax=Klebsiella TaxID=570 RepID=UPI00200CA7AF|nr:nitrogenase iron-molybdenum cofactor biosynthesis protein NifN [Klebsiella quasipneumoniae]HBS5604695.1 nitrogenase iron-molybdenum cofactor biosynthesis protein NifN [Klebsiella quasipneumoniae subsp. quasipneumoniae]MCL1440908.1 nitrogenase iron-molybdenum cofactor biosynthesis protein NifN [Klebsiella quasipneumoniae]MDL4073516.1 nitrogenase iron-molybdenum cofactor biosynthesis protein NifN [Klebsiella quasipneumoniae]HCD8361617.1 nitrogenase iron-molybdenum cofactor biosynthesis protein
MADLIRSEKPLAVSPIKTGQPLGAILASLGLAQAIPLVHGAQGCSAFAKVFFIQHFHDPVPLQSTAMDPTATIMGADGNIFTALDTLCQRHSPQAIVLLSTGLAEAQGSDIARVVRQFREAHPRHNGVAILTVNTPDFFGSMENGYSAVIESIIEQWVAPTPRPGQRPRRVNLLVSHLCSPGDIEWLSRCVEAFGLQPVVLPDLSLSMDGHLGQGDFTPLTQGGASLRQIAQMGQSLGSFAIGVSLQRAASLLSQRSRGEVIALPHLMTLDHCDTFIHQLAKLSGRRVPAWIERQRGQLQDAMIDCHMWLQGQRMAMAAEGDLLAAWCDFARSQGIQPGPLVAPTSHPSLRQLPVERVVPGDLEDLQQLLSHQPADLLVANSHARDLAEQFALPLIRVGFPLFDRLGEFRRVRQGYAGMRDTLFELANLLRDRHHHTALYRSPLRQGADPQQAPGDDYAAH